MSRSQRFDNLARLIRIARYSQKKGITNAEGLEHALTAEAGARLVVKTAVHR
jgi:hypothetical protein